MNEERSSLRTTVRQRLVKALSSLHPHVELVRVRAWQSDTPPVGARWVADERSQGKGTYDAYLVLVKRPRRGSDERPPKEVRG